MRFMTDVLVHSGRHTRPTGKRLDSRAKGHGTIRFGPRSRASEWRAGRHADAAKVGVSGNRLERRTDYDAWRSVKTRLARASRCRNRKCHLAERRLTLA